MALSAGIDRRTFFTRSAALGCCLAASPLATPVSLAAAPWDTRLVVIVLRGGMDGLDVVQPYGDPAYAALRPRLAGGPEQGSLDLDGYFALHPGLADLMPWWRAGELGFVHAVATPYRGKRSHFDGQDLLEEGSAALGAAEGGWLNRLLQALPGVEARTSFALGHGQMKLIAGQAPYSQWSPEAELVLSPQAERLAGLLMEEDALFHAALSEALELSRDGTGAMQEGVGGMAAGGMDGQGQPRQEDIAAFAARHLRGDARIATFSLTGWDTHNRQQAGLRRTLPRLAQTLTGLRAGLGAAVWGKTAVMAVTEFGRTARENGSGGTDHGTGGAMILAGGALRGGRVHGAWPGLAEADLLERRDLMPTSDLRRQMAWVLHGVTGAPRQVLEQRVFPGLDMGGTLRLLR